MFVRCLLVCLVLVLGSAAASAAEQPPAPAKYWVLLRDKHGVQFDPAAYFSPQAQARRLRQGLPPADTSDFPLRADYLRQVQSIADSVTGVSRWFNAVACRATPAQAERLRRLPGVRAVHPMILTAQQPASRLAETPGNSSLTPAERQLARRQTRSLGSDVFRRAGLDGQGKRIAVFDVGFSGADTHPAFAHLRDQKRIVATQDFVRNRPDVYAGGAHGTQVLSCLAGLLPDGTPLGMATGAEYLLARTERLHRELYSEEEAWLAAAEWADRHGADIINSSLGYTDRRYFREQMNGRTSLVARAAAMAARKGMLVVCAAGNDGDDPRWRIIGTPADGDSVLAVGGIDPDTWLPMEFSSCGPAAGGRRKPNVAAYGVVLAAAPSGYVRTEGTSFASPLVAGFAACEWQRNPRQGNMELFRRLEQASTLYPYFDYANGYGLPQARSGADIPATCDIVRRGEVLQVVLRPEPTKLAVTRLPMYADSAEAVGSMAAEPAGSRVPRVGKETTVAEHSDPTDTVLPLPPHPDYFYWHQADGAGRLRRYRVLEVTQRVVLELPVSSFQPGDVLRVHYRGYTTQISLP